LLNSFQKVGTRTTYVGTAALGCPAGRSPAGFRRPRRCSSRHRRCLRSQTIRKHRFDFGGAYAGRRSPIVAPASRWLSSRKTSGRPATPTGQQDAGAPTVSNATPQIPNRPHRLHQTSRKPKTTPDAFSRIENLRELVNAPPTPATAANRSINSSTTRPHRRFTDDYDERYPDHAHEPATPPRAWSSRSSFSAASKEGLFTGTRAPCSSR